MKNYFLILFLVFSSALLKAQSNTFEKVIDTLGSAGSFCIRETFDGGYVYCGTSQYGGNDAEIVKLDSTGQIEWAKTYGGPGIESAQTIEQTPDSGYMVNASYDSGLNSKSWLLRLDANGDTLWTKVFSAGNGGTEVNSGNSMSNFNNIIYGLTSYFKPSSNILNAYFIGAFSNGNFISSKLYNYSTFGTESYSIANTNNGFIIAGLKVTSVNTSDFYLIRTNIYGDTLWTTTLDKSQYEIAMAVQQITDSNFIAVGFTYDPAFIRTNIFLFKADTAGNIIGTKQFYSPFNQVANSFQQTSDGGYIITGNEADTSGRHVLLIKTDANADTLWTRRFDVSTDCMAYFVRQTKDLGYIISGLSNSGSAGTYIIKTDSMGRVSSATGMAEVNNALQFNIFPNPSAGAFSVQLKGISKQHSFLEMYNLNNQLVYSCTATNAANEVDISSRPAGMYVVLLRTQDKVFTKKIIVQK